MTGSSTTSIQFDLHPDNQVTEEDTTQLPDFDFLCSGFLELINQFAEHTGNEVLMMVMDEGYEGQMEDAER